MKRPLLLTLTLASLLPASGVRAAPGPGAQAAPRVQFTLTQGLVRRGQQDGQAVEQIVPNVKTVVPGDLLREEISVRNVSGGRLERLFVGMPVPHDTEFVGGATPTTGRWRVEYSIDDGRTYSAVPKRRVTVRQDSRAVTREETAPLTTYTHVRWTVADLRPGETLKFAFRVRVR